MQLITTTSVSATNDEPYGVIAEHTVRLPRSDIVATTALSILRPVITRFEDVNSSPDAAFFAFVSGYRRGTGSYVYTSDLSYDQTVQLHVADCVAVTFALYIARGFATAVGTVFGDAVFDIGSLRLRLEARHSVVDEHTGKVRHTALISSVEGAEPLDTDPEEAALRAARRWLPGRSDLSVVELEQPPTLGFALDIDPYGTARTTEDNAD